MFSGKQTSKVRLAGHTAPAVLGQGSSSDNNGNKSRTCVIHDAFQLFLFCVKKIYKMMITKDNNNILKGSQESIVIYLYPEMITFAEWKLTCRDTLVNK